MLKTIVGTKIGMTRVFDAAGNMIPVTVVSAGPCTVTEVRTIDRDGYTAVQLGFGDIAERKLIKPTLGQFKKRSVAPKKSVQEFRVADVEGFEIGQELKVDMFKAGDFVDVTGTSKGKGFAGAMKRHNFSGAQATHGQSDRQRATGSNSGQEPQRVLKGARRPGHMGHETVTVQRLRVIEVDAEKNLILIEGAVPGAKTATIVMRKTVKRTAPKGSATVDKKKGK